MNAAYAMLEGLLRSELVWRMGLALLHSLWEVSAVAVVLWAVLALRRQSANQRYVLGFAGLALMTVLPLATFFLLTADRAKDSTPQRAAQVVPLPVPALSTFSTGATAETSNLNQTGAEMRSRSSTQAIETVSRAEANRSASRSPLGSALTRWLPAMVLGWLAGVIVLSIWNIGGWLAAQRLRTRRTQPAGADLRARVARAANCIGVIDRCAPFSRWLPMCLRSSVGCGRFC
jgi:hypothetical protein